MLRVKGDSMKDAGILDADYVIVRRQDTAADGEIVVALVGEEAEATVKRFFRESDHVRLQPENDALEPILTTRRAGARTGGRPMQEGVMSAAVLGQPRRAVSASTRRPTPAGRRPCAADACDGARSTAERVPAAAAQRVPARARAPSARLLPAAALTGGRALRPAARGLAAAARAPARCAWH